MFGSSYLNFTTTGEIQSLGFTSTSSPTSKPTQSSGTQSSGTGASPTSDNQSSSSSAAPTTKPSGIGTGAIAGIAVVVAVLVISAVLGWFFWYQKRKRGLVAKDQQQFTDTKPPYHAVPQQHVDALGRPVSVPFAEAPGIVDQKPAEMGTYVKGEHNPAGIAELGDTAR